MKMRIWNELLLCGVLSLMACQGNDFPQGEEDTSLYFTVRSSENLLVTRGVEDLNDDGTVTEEELIVDGRKMYRLAVFLLEDDRVVSSTLLETDDSRFSKDKTEATVSFAHLDYSKAYRLYAVANYGNYGELTGRLSTVTGENIASGLTVGASNDNLCSLHTPCPLTLKQEVSLTPGTNTISGELLRTYARLRINVRNQSSQEDLRLTELSFAQKFTQRSVDIFTEGGVANVAPVVTSADAVTPFVQNRTIAKIDDEGRVSEVTIFDAYLLESTDGDYNYTLGLQYGGTAEDEYTVSSTAISNRNGIEDEAMYVIYDVDAEVYLCDNGNGRVECGNSYLTDGELNHNYVWKFNSLGSNRYTIESMGSSGYYMQSSNVSSSQVPLVAEASNSDYFTAGNNDWRIYFQSTSYYYDYYRPYNYYLSANSSSVYGGTSSSGRFYLYEVETVQQEPGVTHEETIPIRVIDKNSGEASPLTAIRRNDFIEISVSVTYNEKAGDVDFEVTDWVEVNGEVIFD